MKSKVLLGKFENVILEKDINFLKEVCGGYWEDVVKLIVDYRSPLVEALERVLSNIEKPDIVIQRDAYRDYMNAKQVLKNVRKGK